MIPDSKDNPEYSAANIASKHSSTWTDLPSLLLEMQQEFYIYYLDYFHSMIFFNIMKFRF